MGFNLVNSCYNWSIRLIEASPIPSVLKVNEKISLYKGYQCQINKKIDFFFQVINIEETMAVLTRCSFDESHRQPIFLLGGIPALAELIQVNSLELKLILVDSSTHLSSGRYTRPSRAYSGKQFRAYSGKHFRA